MKNRTLEEHLPVKADKVVGTCVDTFHKDPQRIRKILADPSNLPHHAIIDVGSEKLSLKVSAVNNRLGEYIGAMAIWEVVTGQLNLANSVKDVVGTVASAAHEMEASAQTMSATAEETSAHLHQCQNVVSLRFESHVPAQKPMPDHLPSRARYRG